MEENICVSVRLLDRPDAEQPEPFFIEGSLKWRDLEAMLKAFYEPPQKQIDVRYLDDENDQIIVSCQEEFTCALGFCKDTESVLQLYVRSRDRDPDDTVDSSPATAEKKTVEAAEAKPVPDSTTKEPSGESEHVMMPGATSGANAVAIEMPECPAEVEMDAEKEEEKPRETELAVVAETGEATSTAHHHHGTEVAEPAEMAETGEVAPKSRRDAETGFWMITGAGKKRKTPLEKTDQTLIGVAAALEKPSAVVVAKHVKKRDRQTESAAVKSEKRHKTDKEPRDESPMPATVSGNMTFPVFVAFMSKLKKELRTEIVHDVTKKTVKQVLRGLETLQLQSPQQEQVPHEGKTRANNWPVYTHDSILCDNCERTIVGPRYKCGNCLNYDLCEECENIAGVHDENHVFLKLRRPCQMAGYRHGKRTPLLRHVVYTTQIIEECPETECQKTEHIRGPFNSEKLARKAEKLKLKQMKLNEKLARKEEKLKRRFERLAESLKVQDPQQQPSAVKKERMDIPPYGTLEATFMSDETLPDGTIVTPGERLEKTWRVKNTGTMAWPASTVLREIWSNMEAESAVVPVPSVAPGQVVDVTVHLIAPTISGRYESHWRFQVDGRMFGHSLYAIIIVGPAAESVRPDQDKAETSSALVVPMLKVLCSGNMENLGNKMSQLSVSNAEEAEEKASEEPEEKEEEEEEAAPKENPEDDHEEAGEVEEDSGAHGDTAGPMSVAGMNNLLSFVVVEDVERPPRVHCPPPQVVVKQYEDKDFWAKKLSILPGQGEPATPNNTPLDVSPPPERIIPIPEPELLRKLSLEAEVPKAEPVQPSNVMVIVEESAEDVKEEERSPVENSSFEHVEEYEQPAASSTDQVLSTSDSTPPHVDVEEDMTTAAEGKLQAGRRLYDEGELRPGQTPPKDLRWWEEREDRETSPVSTASSVEVMSAGELEDEEGEEEKKPTLSEYMAKHTLFPPHGWTEDADYDHIDMESFDSLSDDSSIDDDFFIVKLPDCFDTSKPLVFERVKTSPPVPQRADESPEPAEEESQAQPEAPEVQAANEEDEEEEEESSPQPSLDDMLQASGTISAPTLVPTTAPAALQTPAGPDTLAEGPEDPSNVEAAAGEFQDAQEPPEDDVIPGRQDSSAADGTSGVSAAIDGEQAHAEPDGAAGGAAAGASIPEGNHYEPLDPSHQMNQLMQSAVAVASKAAVRAFTTAKDVFYTLQARQHDWKPSTWKPPQSTWKPPQSTWKPPQSEWKPPSNEWKPPSDDWKPPSGDWKPPNTEWKPPNTEWKPPSDSWVPPPDTERKIPVETESPVDNEEQEEPESVSEPMKRLWEMGFFNRELNQRLLDKYNGDLEPVVQELLRDLDNDWAHSRH